MPSSTKTRAASRLRRRAQVPVGGHGQVGQQRHRGIGVVGEQRVSAPASSVPASGETSRERGVPGGQLGPADAGRARPGSAVAAQPGGRPVLPPDGPARAGPASGPSAFPRPSPAALSAAVPSPVALSVAVLADPAWSSSAADSSGSPVPSSPPPGVPSPGQSDQTRASSSSMTDSGLRSQPSAILIRPDSAA